MFLIKALVVSVSWKIEPDHNLFLEQVKGQAVVTTLQGKIKDPMYPQEILMLIIINLAVRVRQTDIKPFMGEVLQLELVEIMKYKN